MPGKHTYYVRPLAPPLPHPNQQPLSTSKKTPPSVPHAPRPLGAKKPPKKIGDFLREGELNPGERHLRDTQDDGTVTLCTLCVATVLSCDCRAEFGCPLTKKAISHFCDCLGVTAPLQTNIVPPHRGVESPPFRYPPPLKSPRGKTHKQKFHRTALGFGGEGFVYVLFRLHNDPQKTQANIFATHPVRDNPAKCLCLCFFFSLTPPPADPPPPNCRMLGIRPLTGIKIPKIGERGLRVGKPPPTPETAFRIKNPHVNTGHHGENGDLQARSTLFLLWGTWRVFYSKPSFPNFLGTFEQGVTIFAWRPGSQYDVATMRVADSAEDVAFMRQYGRRSDSADRQCTDKKMRIPTFRDTPFKCAESRLMLRIILVL